MRHHTAVSGTRVGASGASVALPIRSLLGIVGA